MIGDLYAGSGYGSQIVCGCGLVVQLDGLPTDGQGNRIHGSHYSPSGVPVSGDQPRHAARVQLVLNQLIMNSMLTDQVRVTLFDTLNTILRPEVKERINMLVQQAPVRLSSIGSRDDEATAAVGPDMPAWRFLDPVSLEAGTRIELRGILEAELSVDVQNRLRSILDSSPAMVEADTNIAARDAQAEEA